MDGTYQSKIEKWLKLNISKVRDKKSIAFHVDDFLDEEINSKEMLNISLEIYKYLIPKIKRSDMYMLVLVIPLKTLKKIKLSIPETDKLYKQLSKEPPSIYLMDRNISKYFQVVEEFKIPIKNILQKYDKNIFSYYRVFRDPDSIKNNWEYSRSIYLEFYPDHLVLE